MTTTPPPPTTLQTKLSVLFFLVATTITSVVVIDRLTCLMTDLHRSPKGVLTVNPYVVRAGTLRSGDGGTLALNQADLLNDRWRLGPADALAGEVVKDNVLWDQLGPAIRPTLNGLQLDDNDRLLARTHESLPARLDMTLLPELQARAASLVQCYTGDVSQCDALPPRRRSCDARFSTPGAPRSAMSWVANPGESKRILNILGGVTAKSFGGTAAEACHLVVGDCPRDGLADFSGKTGTSDFASSDGLHVEEGEQFPSKHMVARFMAGGRWYITAAAAFRTRDRLGRHLENANAAAELVLLARSAIAGMQLAASPTALE